MPAGQYNPRRDLGDSATASDAFRYVVHSGSDITGCLATWCWGPSLRQEEQPFARQVKVQDGGRKAAHAIVDSIDSNASCFSSVSETKGRRVVRIGRRRDGVLRGPPFDEHATCSLGGRIYAPCRTDVLMQLVTRASEQRNAWAVMGEGEARSLVSAARIYVQRHSYVGGSLVRSSSCAARWTG